MSNSEIRSLLALLLTLVSIQLGAQTSPWGTSSQPMLGLPPLPTLSALPGAPPYSPAQLATQAVIGQRLFFDRHLSADGTISCASCHQPEHAFTDGRSRSVGIHQQSGTRNASSLWNAVYLSSFFWDGRRASLQEQAVDPFLHPREHGLGSPAKLVAQVRADKAYAPDFSFAFGIDLETAGIGEIAQALAQFEQTLVAGDSPFDRFYFGDAPDAMSASAKRGLQLFQGRALCSSCHTIEAMHALLTDQKFHSLNVGMQQIDSKLSRLTTQLVKTRTEGRPNAESILDAADISELGRFAITLNPKEIGAFRTPSLRNVALTAPYMHDGSVATLDEAVDLELYYRGTQTGQPLILTSFEKADLVAFLKALSSPQALTFKAAPN